mgnify:CR=1 FL=1
MVVFCRFTCTKRDKCDQLEFYCSHFERRMEIDLLEKCQHCTEYKSM